MLTRIRIHNTAVTKVDALSTTTSKVIYASAWATSSNIASVLPCITRDGLLLRSLMAILSPFLHLS